MDAVLYQSQSLLSRKAGVAVDGHRSHVTFNSLNMAKTNGIHLLTFPLHCSHKLQPLDRYVYGRMRAKTLILTDTPVKKQVGGRDGSHPGKKI